MVVSFRIDVAGVQVVSRDLARARHRVGDLRPALNALAAILVEENRANFSSEGAASVYGRWDPLSPNYRRWKEKHYPGKPILVRTGALEASLTSLPMGVQTATSTTISLGTDIEYARYHQTGTRNMPRRAPVALTERAKRDMVKVIQKWIVDGTV